MNLHKNIALFAAVMFAVACGNMGLTHEELRTIDSADSNGIMRVLTIYDRTDSLVLRTPCADFGEEDLERMFADSLSPCARLASQMVATVTSPEQDGVGIAGPQVGISRRIIAVQRFDKPGNPFEVYPNVRILEGRGDRRTGVEGCLSIPGNCIPYYQTAEHRREVGHRGHQLCKGCGSAPCGGRQCSVDDRRRRRHCVRP